MTDDRGNPRRMRLLAGVLLVVWAATAIAIAAEYRPGGPVDIVVVLACFLPVLIAAVALEWPPESAGHRDRVAIGWIWIAALLFAIPVLYGVASTLTAGGPQILVPSAEAAYAGLIALFLLSFFSVSGVVHARRGVLVLERGATLRSMAVSIVLTLLVAAAFGMIAFINDQALRLDEPTTSRYGPTDPELVPPLCHEPLSLGRFALITITAVSSEDDVPRGSAILTGRRSGIDEAWGGSWQGPDSAGQTAYLRLGETAWLNPGSDDPEAPGTTWQETTPGLFEMAGPHGMTTDGPPQAVVGRPRGSIVTEDLGLEVMDGARARHCRTFIDGPTAMAAYLPLRWLLDEDVTAETGRLQRWRGEMDWWVFGDGELGLATVEISGIRAETGWDSHGVRAVLEARLEATDRNVPVDVTASVPTSSAVPRRVEASSSPTDARLESAAP